MLRAETGALQEDLKTSGRHMGVALALFGAAVLLSFWVLGLLVFLLVALLHVWLQLWAAALLVLLAFAGVMFVLALAGRSQWRKAENPVDSVKRHVDDHLDWWQNGLLAKDKTLDISPAPAGDISEDLP